MQVYKVYKHRQSIYIYIINIYQYKNEQHRLITTIIKSKLSEFIFKMYHQCQKSYLKNIHRYLTQKTISYIESHPNGNTYVISKIFSVVTVSLLFISELFVFVNVY